MSGLSGVELAGVAAVMTDAGVALAGPLEATLISGGKSNLTFRLTDGSSRWVLRTPPRVGRTPSAHDVAREFRVTSALVGSGVPVARPVVLHEDEALLGGPFTIVDHVDGRSIQSRADLDTVDDAGVALACQRLCETLAALHRVDHVAVGLETFGRPDGYAARQLRRWSGQWEHVTPGEPALDRLAHELAATLTARIPDQRHVAVVHGDYRIDNTLLEVGADDVRVKAVVDWELSTIGDPVADVALMCVYRDPALDDILGTQSAWTSERLPTEGDLAAAYEKAGGVELADWEFHLALARFKLAVIAAGIDHRHRAGAGSGVDTSGLAVPVLLESGLALLA